MGLFRRFKKNADHDPPVAWREQLRDQEFYIRRILCIHPSEEQMWRKHTAPSTGGRQSAPPEQQP